MSERERGGDVKSNGRDAIDVREGRVRVESGFGRWTEVVWGSAESIYISENIAVNGVNGVNGDNSQEIRTKHRKLILLYKCM